MAFLATRPAVGFSASGVSRAAAAAPGTPAHRGAGREGAPAFRSSVERVCQASAVIPLAVSPIELEEPQGAPASPSTVLRRGGTADGPQAVAAWLG